MIAAGTLAGMGAPRLGLLAVGAAASAVGASSAGTPAAQALSALHVPRALAVGRDVRISFRASQRPEGGYYYAVIVLKPYKRYTRPSPPPCSASSDMRRADYGYPQRDGVVKLALAPASSRTGRWCRGGTYAGAIYAVPHAPPCEAGTPVAANRGNLRVPVGASMATSRAASWRGPPAGLIPRACRNRSRGAQRSWRASRSGSSARARNSPARVRATLSPLLYRASYPVRR